MLSRGRSGVWAPVAVFIGVVKSNDIIQIAGECVNHEWGHVFPHIEQEAANLMFQLPIDLNRKEGLCCPIVVLRFCVRKAHVQIHVAFNNITNYHIMLIFDFLNLIILIPILIISNTRTNLI